MEEAGEALKQDEKECRKEEEVEDIETRDGPRWTPERTSRLRQRPKEDRGRVQKGREVGQGTGGCGEGGGQSRGGGGGSVLARSADGGGMRGRSGNSLQRGVSPHSTFNPQA